MSLFAQSRALFPPPLAGEVDDAKRQTEGGVQRFKRLRLYAPPLPPSVSFADTSPVNGGGKRSRPLESDTP
jgi:hypothetical protein